MAIPAVDLRDGACVQLVGGAFDDERIRIPDPLGAARRWTSAGFARLHVVDLDAANGTGANDAVVDQIVRDGTARVTVGGGIRTTERAASVLGAGAEHVVVGTRAIDDPAWLETMASTFPGCVIIAADVRDRRVVTHAWTKVAELDVLDLLRQIDHLPLAGVLVTAVHQEGRLAGPDLPLIEDAVRTSRHPILASGGITTIDDLRALAARGARAGIIGMALYSGVLDARAVAAEFCE